VRIDAAAGLGTVISPDYDSMIAKLIVWAPTRDAARARLRRAIDEYAIGGVPTTLGFLRALNDTEPVARGDYGTATLEAFAATWKPADSLVATETSPVVPAASGDPDVVRVEVNDKLYVVRIFDRPATRAASASSASARPAAPKAGNARARSGRASSGNDVVSPMHGVVVEVGVAAGDEVREGQVVAVIEAMKMMNEIRAHRAGSVSAVVATVGATVEADAPLLTLA
jgi:acetyl-CoA/propionyl-CoA carboxylase biotin carboxyl carrier protein